MVIEQKAEESNKQVAEKEIHEKLRSSAYQYFPAGQKQIFNIVTAGYRLVNVVQINIITAIPWIEMG